MMYYSSGSRYHKLSENGTNGIEKFLDYRLPKWQNHSQLNPAHNTIAV
jgi:hypothetical protein